MSRVVTNLATELKETLLDLDTELVLLGDDDSLSQPTIARLGALTLKSMRIATSLMGCLLMEKATRKPE